MKKEDDLSIIGRLHRNAVKQRLFRRFVRRTSPPVDPVVGKRAADVYFCIAYGEMSRKRASEIFGISVERVRQILHQGKMIKLMNSYQVCHPSGSCLIGAKNLITMPLMMHGRGGA